LVLQNSSGSCDLVENGWTGVTRERRKKSAAKANTDTRLNERSRTLRQGGSPGNRMRSNRGELGTNNTVRTKTLPKFPSLKVKQTGKGEGKEKA